MARKSVQVLAGLHALHEQVGNPVRRVHVVRAAAVVAGVLAQLEELEDVVVPGLEVGAAGALALAALVDGDELVVVELQERDDALGLAVGAADVGAGAADGGPRAAEAAGPLGEEGVFGDAAEHDALDGVVDVVEVAGAELGVERAGVEEGRRAAAEAAALVELVEARWRASSRSPCSSRKRPMATRIQKNCGVSMRREGLLVLSMMR